MSLSSSFMIRYVARLNISLLLLKVQRVVYLQVVIAVTPADVVRRSDVTYTMLSTLHASTAVVSATSLRACSHYQIMMVALFAAVRPTRDRRDCWSVRG
jgi:hypothetical protein